MSTRLARLPGFMMLAALIGAAAGSAATPRTIVVCSPGSPGTTLQAQPTMDAFAQAVAQAAGRPAGSLAAVYHETAESGLARLAKDDAALAMVPLPFLLRYGVELSLQPKLEAVQDSGEPEVWSLVAKKGTVTSAASLAGWEITGAAGYAEGFVRGALLGEWGALPADAKVTFTARPLTGLRRAAAGEKVAVLLDKDQTHSLSTLPFAAELDVVTHSKPVPSGFMCSVGTRMPAPEADKLFKAMQHLNDGDAGRELLKTMWMTKFKEADLKAIDALRKQAAGTK